jgi:Lon protease-like protein
MSLTVPGTIPLFPLNVVLFPGAVLPLHIFEPRYRAMMERCLEDDPCFGIVLQRAEEGAVRETIGTVARIRIVAKLHDGRYNVVVVGESRFEIVETWMTADGYLEATVSLFRDDPAAEEALGSAAAELESVFEEYYTRLRQRSGVKLPELELPDDPEALSLLIAGVVQMPLERAQRLLADRCTLTRIEDELDMLRSLTVDFSRGEAKPLVAVPFRPNRWEKMSRN